MISSLFFPNEDEIIEYLGYLSNEFPKLDAKRNKNVIRTYVACEVKTNKDIYVICIEMQIEDKGSLTKRLFNYGTSLRNNNSYKNCYSLGISLSSRNGSNLVKLKKKTYESTTTLKYIKTAQIDINEELENLKNDEIIKVYNKEITRKGVENLKLFGIRIWGKMIDRKYILPDDEIFVNDTVKECIEILSKISNDQISKMIIDEQYYFDVIQENKEEGINEGLIVGAYGVFLASNNNYDNCYKFWRENEITINSKDEIRKILSKKDENLIEDLINYLEKKKVLS